MGQRLFSWSALLVVMLLPTGVQALSVSADALECIPVEEHSIVRARVIDEVGGTTTRLYFRRLHEEVEDFYYVEMVPAGGGRFWAALPKPTDDLLERRRLKEASTDLEERYPWAAWWKAKEASADRDPNGDLDREVIEERASLGKRESRDWMVNLSLAELESWLESLDRPNRSDRRDERERIPFEPAEYYAAVVDGAGRVLAKSAMLAVDVSDDCRVSMTPQEQGRAWNLVVGETARWQVGEEIFHWLCDHVVSRIDPENVLRVDPICRSCVIGDRRQRRAEEDH